VGPARREQLLSDVRHLRGRGALSDAPAPASRQEPAGHRAAAGGEVEPGRLDAFREAFAAAAAEVLSRYSRPGRNVRRAIGEPGAVRRARALAHARYTDPRLAVNELAKAAGLSDFHFMRVFRAATGVMAHAYVVQLRLADARARLARGTSAAEAAVAAGFADQSHLTRHFRAAFGTTPGRYAEETRRRWA